ncbi:hypothetical protein [Gulosibacter sp. ACHW.36C]|uniref:Uncharacterized protein n=1 Tax=Gulosibacter sediminis TaxID=1729695 RepID=A0ABY4N2X5_9MICO|nr:hypothetical protein [Gulosibacter sediminis]UQN15878.1 hypothetical protein M3M28_05355 [Gulosibacter sediminis]
MSWNDGSAGPFGRNNNDDRPEHEAEQNNPVTGDASDDAAASTPAMPDLPPLPPLASPEPDAASETPESPETPAGSDAPQGDSSGGGWSAFAPPTFGSSSNDSAEFGDAAAQGEPAPAPSIGNDSSNADDNANEGSFAAALGANGDAHAAREEAPHDEGATQSYPTAGFPAGVAGDAPTTPYDREHLSEGAASSPDAQPTQAYNMPPFQAEAPATQSFGAPPAAFPGDSGNRPGAAYGAPVAGPGGPGGAGGNEPPRNEPKKKKPWFRRTGFIVTAIVAVVVIAAAAIGIPWFIHSQNVQRGDDLAAAFQQELSDYNGSWNAENLAAVTAPEISSVLTASSQTFFDLTTDGVDSLSAACGDIAGGQDTRQHLADTTVPELPADEGAEASEAYQQAQADADALASSREQAETFLTQSDSYLAAQQQVCDSLPAYAELQQNYRDDLNTTMPDAYVIENGGEITTNDGAIYFPCSNASGCPDLYNDDTRETFASAYESTYVDYYAGLAKQYSENCFLDAFQSVCDVAATEYQNAADANQAVVDHLRNTEPTVEVGQTLYPDLDGLIQDAQSAEDAANSAVLTEWQSVEPNVGSSLTRTGASLATYLDGLKSDADSTASSIVG